MKTPLLRLFAFGILMFVPCLAWAKTSLIPIPAGMSARDLTGDGRPEKILKLWRENYNAHGYYVLIFLEDGTPPSVIGILPHNQTTPQNSLETRQGADCVVRDFRLMVDENATTLVQAEKSTETADYSASAPVIFAYYTLKHNKDGAAGSPAFSFEWIKTQTSTRPYCDVNEAFERERVF